MKTFKLSALALACLTFFYSCTKDAPATEEQAALMQNARVAAQGGNPNAGNSNATSIEPTTAVTFSQNPSPVNQPVTITALFPTVAGEVPPSCGKIQLQQETAPGVWTTVSQEKLVTLTDKQVSITFTPTVVGTYNYKVHYVAGNCNGYNNSTSSVFTLTVVQPCSFAISGVLTSAVPSATANAYDFTVTYTVNTCSLQFDKLKTQGGLTNGSTLISAAGVTGLGGWIPGSSTNRIINWIETPVSPATLVQSGTRTYVIKFTKEYSGSGPIELTGDWSSTATLNGVTVATANFPAINHVQ